MMQIPCFGLTKNMVEFLGAASARLHALFIHLDVEFSLPSEKIITYEILHCFYTEDFDSFFLNVDVYHLYYTALNQYWKGNFEIIFSTQSQ